MDVLVVGTFDQALELLLTVQCLQQFYLQTQDVLE